MRYPKKIRIWACAMVALTTVGCSSPLAIRPELPDREPPDHLRQVFDYYAERTFKYEENRCWIRRTELDEVEFTCGVIELRLQPGVGETDIQGSLTEVGGIVLSVEDGTDDVLIVRVQVPRYQEGHALLHLLTDPQLFSANLSLLVGVVLM